MEPTTTGNSENEGGVVSVQDSRDQDQDHGDQLSQGDQEDQDTGSLTVHS